MADTFAGAAQKVDNETAELEQEDEILKALEEELEFAQRRLDVAESRFAQVYRQQQAELAKPFDEEKRVKPASVPKDSVKVEDIDAPEHKEHTIKGTSDTKNTSTKTEKEAKREKWVATRDAALRVRDATKKGRDKLRKAARDKRFQGMEEEAGGESPAAAAVAAVSAAVAESKPKAAAEPSYDSEVVKAGATTLAERLQSLKDRPNDAERRTALVRVLTGGKENYYTSEPGDILDDLEGRKLVDADFASLLFTLLKSDPSKGQGVPPEEWLAHAKKVSAVTRKDDEPFTEAEDMYLKWVDKQSMAEAEQELDAAESKLQELIKLSDAWYGEEEGAETSASVPASAPEVDADYADKLQAQHDPKREESRGAKNTSALSSKVVSKEKWLSERRKEVQERESRTKAREARRAENRARKNASGDV